MTRQRRIVLPRQWPQHIRSGVLHAISLASVVVTCVRAQATGRQQIHAQLEQARNEIAMLREEMSIKDGRWGRSRIRRRPHYTPIQRMRILQLRAARGWTLEKTARRFLVDLQTLLHWLRRVDEQAEHALVQTNEPVNRYPDVVRNLVRQLKCHFPSMGYERMAQVLARIGLFLAATTLRRIVRDTAGSPPQPPAASSRTARRRAVARHPGDVWHIDLTAVPTRAGASVPWLPFALPQRWPYCWWVAVIVDQVSRCFVGFAVFSSMPTAKQLETCLERAVRRLDKPPRYIVSDRGSQFTSRSYRRWCGRHGTHRRFGFLGEPNSIAIVERFIRSMKQECFRRLLLAPMTLAAMRRELGYYARWYNEYRPHTTLRGKTPGEVFRGRARRPRRIETRERWPYQPRGRCPANTVTLDVSYVAGRKHLPVIGLRRAA